MNGVYKTTPDKMRECSKCGKAYSESDFHHQKIKMKNGRTWKGYRPECKHCRNAERKEIYKNRSV